MKYRINLMWFLTMIVVVGISNANFYDFEGGGPGFTINGNAAVDSGSMRLTPALNSQMGSVIFDPISSDPVTDFDVSFDFYAGPGDGADGIAFALLNTGVHNSTAIFGESGPGVGSLSIGIDLYDNGGEAQAGGNYLDIRLDNVVVASAIPSFTMEGTGWHHVEISFDEGKLTLELTPEGGIAETIFDAVTVTGFTPFAGIYGFGARTGGLNNEHRIDNVLFVSNATNLFPANGAINVPVEAILSWEDVLVDPAYIVHFGTEPNIPQMTMVIDKEHVNSYDPELDYNSQYYWAVSVEGVDPNGIPILLEGPVLGFKTAPKTPVVIGQPTNQDVYPGEDATYSVEVLSAAGAEVSYEWFKEGDATVLSTEASLTIADAQIENEGMYYCKATNEFGSDTSISAKLFIKLLVSHWPLDEDFEDKIGGRHGVPVGDPLPVIDTEEKIDGAGSAKFTIGGAAAQAVRIPTAGLPTGSSMTISFWEKTPADGPANGYMLASADADPAGVSGFEYLYWWRRGGNVHYLGLYTTDYTINGDNFNTGNFASGDLGGIAREEWHLCTLVYNYDGPSWQYYVDGEFRYNYGTMARRFEGFVDDLLIANRHNMVRAFMGNIDDLRIYNFAMDAVEIATLYTDTVGGYVCVTPVPYDLNDDCIIDIGDLAVLGANWLECNSVPATACQ